MGMELSTLQRHYDELSRENDDLKSLGNEARAGLEEAKRRNENR